jgi:hypothetical protein
MRKLLFAVAAAAFALAPVLSSDLAQAQSPIVIKFSHVVANDTPKGKGALKFKELAEKYTDGKVKIEVYPNSSLYKDKEEIEALQLGSVQMLAPSTAKFAPLGIKEFEALDLPWLFKDDQTYSNAMKGTVGKWLFQSSADETRGFQGPEIPHLRIEDRRPVFPPDRLDPADHGVLGSLPGAADRRGRRLREHRIELLDAEILRGAEGHHRVLSRASAIRRHRQLEILVRLAARHPRPARKGDE